MTTCMWMPFCKMRFLTAFIMPRGCPCFSPQVEEISLLDFRHCNLLFVPEEIYEFEKSLEELYVDSNNIKDLPRPLFHCQNLRKLGASDNELCVLPPAIASLVSLEELDISKNGIVELPDNIKCCKNLHMVELSVNPIGKLPDGFTQLLNLTHLYLNDTFLDYLPANFGRLTKLRILEIRENHLKSLPKSMSRLTVLERLDLGNNYFEELPEVVGTLANLTELWVDSNALSKLPPFIGKLSQLQYFDGCKNKIKELPDEIGGLLSLSDLHLSTNNLRSLPDTVGKLDKLSTLKVDDNQLFQLPHTIGGLTSMEELILNMNDLEELPPSIGLLRNMRNLNVDDNFLLDLPSELGSCSNIRLLSLRGNRIELLPDELGRIHHLTVVNLSNNRLKYLPFSFTKLKNLQALWLSDNQSKPLIPLQTDWDESYRHRVLTCFMFPQQPKLPDDELYYSDGDSFHASQWEEERLTKTQIAFDVKESDSERSFKRTPTPYPKEAYKTKKHVPQANGDIRDTANSSDGYPNDSRKLGSHEMSLGPDIKIREAKVTKPGKPSSPLHDRHYLYKADKEKRAKDKARIRRNSRDSTGTDGESDSSPSRSLPSSSNSSPTRKPNAMVNSIENKRQESQEDVMVAPKEPIVTAAPPRDSPSPDSGKGSPGERSPLTSTSPMDSSPVRTMPDGCPVRSVPDGASSNQQTSPSKVLPPPNGSPAKTSPLNEENVPSTLPQTGSPMRAPGKAVPSTLPPNRSPTRVLPSYEETIAKRLESPKREKDSPLSSSSQKILNTELKDSQRDDLPERPQTLDIVNRNVHSNDKVQHEKKIDSISPENNYRTMMTNQEGNSRTSTLERTIPGSDAKSPDSPDFQVNSYAETYLKDRPLPNYPDRKLGVKQFPPPPSYYSSMEGKRNSPRNKMSGYASDSRSGYGSDWERSRHSPRQPGYIERDRTGYFSDRERGYNSDWERSGYYSDREKSGYASDRERIMYYNERDRNGYHGDRSGYFSEKESPTGYFSDREGRSGYYSDRERPSGYSSDRERPGYRGPRNGHHLPNARNSPQHGSPIRNYGQILNRLDNVKMRTRSPQPESPLARRRDNNGQPQIPNYEQVMKSRPNNSPGDWREQLLTHVEKKKFASDNEYAHREDPRLASPSRMQEAQAYKNDLRLRMMKQRHLLDAVDGSSEPGSDDVFSSSPQPSLYGRNQQSYTGEGSPRASRRMAPSPPMRTTPVRPQPLVGDLSPRMSPRSSPRQSPRMSSKLSHCRTLEFTISKNPGLGFSIAGGIGSQGNPFRPNDMGIFVTRIQPEGPAAGLIHPGDKILEVNGTDFIDIAHQEAVAILKNSNPVTLIVSRDDR
ncbi:leucine-rich repeat-containing protein 7-like isoform X1 [Ptychodera flava]|uniref:leucine-rich repeat-containing protein 7-like isoform X1 n=1 Tax=Ptychodera flava TaxID=63121 RepID=UPI00396A919D